MSAKSILFVSAMVASAASAASAETRRQTVELPEGVVEMVVEAEEPRWRPKWPWPVPVPPTPAPVLYGRESSLPLCQWGHYEDERSFMQFITDGHGYGDWTCKAVGGGPNDDTCGFTAGPDYKPTDAQYFLAPRDQANNYTDNLEWPDGSGLYGVWYLKCASSGATGGPADIVLSTDVEGGYGDDFAYVAGGVVEHIRPAFVRGTVTIVLPPGNYLPRLENDLTLAIQILGDEGWTDVATSVHTVEKTLMTFEIEATVPELVDVRLDVRADASRGHLGVGYDLRDARIFVETCIPDQNEPGTCLGD